MNNILPKEKVIVLFSGGIDSTALIHYYLSKKFKVYGVFIDYNQEVNISERKAVKNIADYFNIPLKIINLDINIIRNNFEYYMRNSLLINIAMSTVNFKFNLISLGIHQGTEYYDCSQDFVNDIQNILNGYFNGKVMFDTPFINFNKEDILNYFTNNNLPTELTYSCEKRNYKPCGMCPSCLDRREFFDENN